MMMKGEILKFWFPTVVSGETAANTNYSNLMKLWFGSSSETDTLISHRFKETLDKLSGVAIPDLLTHTKFDGPDGRLALVILFDQFTRNIYRNTPKMFSNDEIALSISKHMLQTGEVDTLHPLQKAFILLPLEHSENLSDQDECVRLSEKLATEHGSQFPLLEGFVKYAKEHREIIAKFNRFPHRNAILGRLDSDLEREYLKSLSKDQMFGVSTKAP